MVASIGFFQSRRLAAISSCFLLLSRLAQSSFPSHSEDHIASIAVSSHFFDTTIINHLKTQPVTSMNRRNALLSLVPIAFPLWYLVRVMNNPVPVIWGWIQQFFGQQEQEASNDSSPPVGSQLVAYVVVAIFGFGLTDYLIPNIKVRF